MSFRLFAGAMSAVTAYFVYHALAGEQGLGEWIANQSRLADKKAELAVLEMRIERLKTDISRLTPGAIDPDLVEFLARRDLGYVYPGELILTDNSVNM